MQINRSPDDLADISFFGLDADLAAGDRAQETRTGGQTIARSARSLAHVVDDEPDTLDLLRRVLGDSRAQVAAAPSVEAALATLGGFDPHVLISDVSMPGRDGFELIRAVRSTSSPERLPAASLSAYTLPEDAERARAAGFQVHLSKPVQPEQLVKMVAHLAGRD